MNSSELIKLVPPDDEIYCSSLGRGSLIRGKIQITWDTHLICSIKGLYYRRYVRKTKKSEDVFVPWKEVEDLKDEMIFIRGYGMEILFIRCLPGEKKSQWKKRVAEFNKITFPYLINGKKNYLDYIKTNQNDSTTYNPKIERKMLKEIAKHEKKYSKL
ncbi:MAG: hypothetical protein ACFFAS_15900 [Promethearchaeota archaeon]